jgi:hypothetical protein
MTLQLPLRLHGRCSLQDLQKQQQQQQHCGQICVVTWPQSSESQQSPQMLHGRHLQLRLLQQQHPQGTLQAICRLQQLVTCRCAC